MVQFWDTMDLSSIPLFLSIGKNTLNKCLILFLVKEMQKCPRRPQQWSTAARGQRSAEPCGSRWLSLTLSMAALTKTSVTNNSSSLKPHQKLAKGTEHTLAGFSRLMWVYTVETSERPLSVQLKIGKTGEDPRRFSLNTTDSSDIRIQRYEFAKRKTLEYSGSSSVLLAAFIQKNTARQLLWLAYFTLHPHYEVSVHNSRANESSQVSPEDELIPSLFLDETQALKKGKKTFVLFRSFQGLWISEIITSSLCEVHSQDPLRGNGKG